MKTIRFLMLALLMCILATGCGTKHVNDVPDDQQEVQVYIHDTGVILEALGDAKTTVFDSATEMYTEGTIADDTFAKVVLISYKFDIAYQAAGEAHIEFINAVTEGGSPTRAGLEAAVSLVKSLLTELEKEKGE